ncbi:hypothetical protein LSH36_347g04005 [Paralvinella palmiformis]|uniref:Uncharacterized protein n=1 Tax=Paralvinella palmiformis TaxID=53620 RepID=A0AAD9N067_9ANNE|nr:hypothetical protein LSH36_347g04005 [Paralvinella palmiformis]
MGTRRAECASLVGQRRAVPICVLTNRGRPPPAENSDKMKTSVILVITLVTLTFLDLALAGKGRSTLLKTGIYYQDNNPSSSNILYSFMSQSTSSQLNDQ